MNQEEKKKKSYDEILLNLCLTKDDKIEAVLNKLVPLLMDEIFICEASLRNKLIEIISNCILRCKSIEGLTLPVSNMIEGYFKNINKSNSSRILYNSTLMILLDICFINICDDEKIKYQKLIIENSDKLCVDKEMCIFLIIKFIESLEILNNGRNKKIMSDYLYNDYSYDMNYKIMNFVKYLNEFLLIPIYCKNIDEIKFVDIYINKIYKEKFLNKKGYNIKNHIKMKKNTLYFLNTFINNYNLTYSSYIICSNEKYDEIKDYALSLLQSKRRFINYNDSFFVELIFSIFLYFDNNIYNINYITTLLLLFKNGSRLLCSEKNYLHLILMYIFYFLFYYDSNNININFKDEFNKFQKLFNDKSQFEHYISNNVYSTIRLKDEEFIKNIFDVIITILDNITKYEYIEEYNNYIFLFIFMYLRNLNEHYNDDNKDYMNNIHINNNNNNNNNNISNNNNNNNNNITVNNSSLYMNNIYSNIYTCSSQLSCLIEKFFELNIKYDNINTIVLNKSFILTYIYFDKLRKYKKCDKDSYILYNNIIKVLDILEKYYKHILKLNMNKFYIAYKKVETINELHNMMEYLILSEISDKKEKNIKINNNSNSNNNNNNMEQNVYNTIYLCSMNNWKNIIIENIINIIDSFIYYSKNSVLISTLLKWCVNIFLVDNISSISCAFIYYLLLYENSSDVILSDLSKDYLNLYKDIKISFDEYIYFVSTKLFNMKNKDVLYFLIDKDQYDEKNKTVILNQINKLNESHNNNSQTNSINNKYDTYDNIDEFLGYNIINYNLHMYNENISIDDMKSLIEYSNNNYSRFNLIHLYNLIKYIKNLKIDKFIHIESIYYIFLIMDLYLLNIIKLESYLDNDNYMITYCIVFTFLIKKIKKFFKNHEKNEDNKMIYSFKNISLLNSKVYIIYDTLYILMKERFNLIIQNLLHIKNKNITENCNSTNNSLRLLKYSSKFLTKVYILTKLKNDELFSDLLNFLDRTKFEEIYNVDNQMIIKIYFNLLYFGTIIKKEKKFDEKYYGILEKVTKYIIYIYNNYIKENIPFDTNLLKYCIKFLYLSFFSESFLCNWNNVLKKLIHSEITDINIDNDCAFYSIVFILTSIEKYIKCNKNVKDTNNRHVCNINLLKNVLKLLSCFITLKNDNINNMLKQNIKDCIMYYDMFSFHKIYGLYISHCFLKLDHMSLHKLSYNWLDYILLSDNLLDDLSKNNKIELGEKYKCLCIIMFYIIYYNPFLGFINEHAFKIRDLFIYYIKLKSDIYSEYSFLGLSILFFSLSIQHHMNINSIYCDNENISYLDSLKNDFLLLNEKRNIESKTFENKKGYNILNNVVNKNNMEYINLIDRFNMDNFCMSNFIKKKNKKDDEKKNMNFTIMDNDSYYFINELSCFYKDRMKDNICDYKITCNNNLYNVNNKRVTYDTLHNFVEGILNSFKDCNIDTSFYKNFLKNNNEKDFDENFINEIKKFETRKDHILKNIYEYINNERNINLINQYVNLSKYCYNYIYLFLFMQYSELLIYKNYKKLKYFFLTKLDNININDKNNNVVCEEIFKSIYEKLKRDIYLQIDIENKNSLELYSNNSNLDKYIYNVSDLKKVNKKIHDIIKYMYKEVLIYDIMIEKNDMMKFNFFENICLKDVSKTMIRMRMDFFKMKNEFQFSIYGINLLIRELENFYLINNEIINEAMLIFLNEFLKKINLKEIFCIIIDYFLCFICRIIDTHMMNLKMCIPFLNTFKSVCMKFCDNVLNEKENNADDTKMLMCFERYNMETTHQNNNINKNNNNNNNNNNMKNDYSCGNTTYGDIKNIDERCICSILLGWYEKIEGNKKSELFITDCINSCILSSNNSFFELRNIQDLLFFYIKNSEKIENDYNDLKIEETKKDEITIKYKEKEIYFSKLLRYNNLEKQKAAIEKIVSYYKNVLNIEEDIKNILNNILIKVSIVNSKYILSTLCYIIIKLIDRYEILSGDIYMNVHICIISFELLSIFISKNIHVNYLIHINELLYYLIHKVPFYYYTKFVYFNLLKDYFDINLNFKDIQNVRNYCSSVVLYLLKKHYLLDIYEKHIFRDNKSVENITMYEQIILLKNVSEKIKDLFQKKEYNLNEFLLYLKGKNIQKDELLHNNDDIDKNYKSICDSFLNICDKLDKVELLDCNFICDIKRREDLQHDENYLYIENFILKAIKDKIYENKHYINIIKDENIEVFVIENMINFMNIKMKDILNMEIEKKKLFNEENKLFLKTLESKMLVRSFILRNVQKNDDNNYYKDIYDILQKRNMFHFYKFFNDYIEEFLHFLDSQFLKDKKGCFMSIYVFVQSFVDIYKEDNYDELDIENIKNVINLYRKIKDVMDEKDYIQSFDNYYILLSLLKCVNLLLLLIYNSNNKINHNNKMHCCDKAYVSSSYLNYVHVFEKNNLSFNMNEIYKTYEDLLCIFCKVKEYEIFQHMYIFIFNIPSIFIENFNFVKLYECIVKLMDAYFRKKDIHSDEIIIYDNNFLLHFSKLALCVFSYFLIKKDKNKWLHFYNFEYLNKYIKIEKLNDYTFCLDKIQNENYSNRNNHTNYHYIFLHEYIRINEDKMGINISLMRSKEKTVNNEIQKNNDMKILDKYEEYMYDNNILEVNRESYLNIQEKFFNFLTKLLFILFEYCKDNNTKDNININNNNNNNSSSNNNYINMNSNNNILGIIKSFFHFMFYNKIYLFEIGNIDIWEKIYNYIYLLIIKCRSRKVFDSLMDILNILLCIYNSYSYENQNDRTIYTNIKIKELTKFRDNKENKQNNEYDYIFYNDDNDDNYMTSTINFLFIVFFKFSERSKLFVFPDYIMNNLKYAILLNYPNFLI
ncbi:hypothetical protein PGSY75_1369400 [Plasmodium gaboni]|uniref:Uncharacterized protein n=1 Tax=Plasmodium gaboni TaxID=647221 RepID=A0A151LEX1_9APIC|nr:hypothetical protein PGSY75_1369400 [Plasmodium gaboni]KYN97449.1 hypothetical protein PGSY75_1369400 [Plasmodium gaboni]